MMVIINDRTIITIYLTIIIICLAAIGGILRVTESSTGGLIISI